MNRREFFAAIVGGCATALGAPQEPCLLKGYVPARLVLYGLPPIAVRITQAGSYAAYYALRCRGLPEHSALSEAAPDLLIPPGIVPEEK